MSDMTLRIGHRQQLLAVLMAICVVGGLTIGVGSAVAQDDDDGPPPIPASYYGEITINGEPAPEGVEVTAEIDGEERGSIVTEQEGAYGGAAVTDRKLTVEGSEDDEGASVEFFVDGDPADTDTDVEWESGVNQEVNLTVDTDDDDGASGGTGGGTGGDTGTDDSADATDDTDDTADDDSTDADGDSDGATDEDDDDEDAGVADDAVADTTDGDTDDSIPGFTSLTALVAVSALLGFGYLTVLASSPR